MPKTRPSGPDLLALAMRRARDDVAVGRVRSVPVRARVVGDAADVAVELEKVRAERPTKQAGVKRPHRHE